jgi:hypothetical protein
MTTEQPLTTGHFQMRYMVRSLLGLAFLGFTAGVAGPLQAQTTKPGEPEVLGRSLGRSDSRFRLFGERDFAESGLRMPADFTGCTDNTSNLTTARQCWENFNPRPAGQYNMPSWFDMFFYWAAPPSERNKHAATVPSLANANNKGYTMLSRISEGMTGEILPMDGTLGPFHAGATEAGDGSCLDFRTLPSGVPLLAGNDCPPTWGSQGWQGTRFVDQDGFLAFADQVGDANFSFDSWRVPQELRRNDKFLGDFQTFGFFHDYSADALFGSSIHPSYGNVVPQGDPAEEPTRSGWPLGLMAKMDVFAFFSPGLVNTSWWQLTVVNNSAEVYGVGLDYDSVYMGLQPGWLPYEQGASLYRSPGTGTVRGATFCQTPGCGPGGDPMHPGDQWGSIPPNGLGEGFNYGAAAIIVMKSPIGDLRNKQFSDPASPFFGKGNPEEYDDTITFNHGHMCGFHGCSAVLWDGIPSTAATSDFEQRQFGMVASITSDVIGDRALGDIADHTAWDTWRWEAYPDRGALDFNRWTPGNWDWNDDDVDDELAYDDCSDNSGPQFDEYVGYSKNCSVAWSDSLPGGFGNVYANRGAVTGVGPIHMAAGDTVEWVFAVVHANDLAGIEADIAKAIDHYQAFYLGPEKAPEPTITSVEVQEGGENASAQGYPQAAITLYFDDTSESWEDPFLTKFLDDMLAADPESDLGKIRELNPSLEGTLRDLIPNNVAAIHVFKSCDGGSTFTDDATCFAAPATGGVFGDLGWEPWMTLEPDVDGNFDNVVSDNGIFGGRTFLYTLVTETRGLTVSVRTGVPGNAELTATQEEIGSGDGTEITFTGTLPSIPVAPTTVVISDGNLQTVTDDGAGNLVGAVDPAGNNTIDYETGAYDVSFTAAPAAGATVTADYQYVFVTCIAECGSQTLEIAPVIVPSITTSTGAANVASVYVPVAQQSGYAAATVTLVTASPDFIPFERMNVRPTENDVDDGEYSLVFGDAVTVTEVAIESATGAALQETGVKIVAADGTTTLTTPGKVAVEGTFSEYDLLQEVGVGDGTAKDFTGTLNNPEVVPGSVKLTAGTQVVTDDGLGNLEGDVDALGNNTINYTTGDFDVTFAGAPASGAVITAFYQEVGTDWRTRVWTFEGLTAVLADGSGVPLTVTSDLSGGQTVPGAYFGLANYPGFTFSVDNGVGGTFEGQYYLNANAERIGPLVEPSVTFLDGETSGVTAQGRYRITWSDQPFGPGSPFFLNSSDPDGTEQGFVQSLQARQLGQTASTDPSIASYMGLPAEALLAVRLPFTVENITDIDNPTPVEVVITSDIKSTEIPLGNALSTLNVAVPETEWVPGDGLILVEGSAPDFDITFAFAMVGCLPSSWVRTTCNPLALSSPGATGYIPAKADEELHFGYYQAITSATGYTFDVGSAVTGSNLVENSREAIVAALDSVKVVPNPFVMFSRYSTSANVDRVIFTHVPPQGVVRVFTANGQFVQQVKWTPDDLNERGDLWFNLRTKEGLEMAAGLYLFVLEAQDMNGVEIGTAKGKFVLIK